MELKNQADLSITHGMASARLFKGRFQNARNTGMNGIKEFIDYAKGLPNFKTAIDTTSNAGITISYKMAED